MPIYTPEQRLSALEKKVELMQHSAIRMGRRMATVERAVVAHLGYHLPIMSEQEILEGCPCCGRSS